MPRTFQYYPGAYRRWAATQAELDALVATVSARADIQLQTTAPTITPNGGTFTDAPLVTINTTTPGSIVYYTLNGTNPDGNSTQYTVPFVVGATSTLKCIAVAPGFAPSAVVSAAFTVGTPKCGTPIFTPPAGAYTSTQSVVISSANSESIRYTTDGTTPNGGSPLYTGAITISTTTPLQAIGKAPGYQDSDMAAGVYTIGLPVVDAPVVVPPTETNFDVSLVVTATCATAGALIYYTVDGSTPTQASTLYSSPLTISLTTTFKFRAYRSGYTASPVTTATYHLNTDTVSGFWGSWSAGYLNQAFWITDLTPWSRTLEQVWTTPFAMSFPAAPPAAGPYRFYIVPDNMPPIESGTTGIFTLTPDDFASYTNGAPDAALFNNTDANGWPCYEAGPSGDGYPYRVYRLKYAVNGAIALSIQHQNESP